MSFSKRKTINGLGSTVPSGSGTHFLRNFGQERVLVFFFLYFLFLAVLGLHCCTQAFPSCCERGLLLVAVRGLLLAVASLVAEHGL